MYCHECGKRNPDQAKFCAFCGTRLIAPEALPPEAPDLALEELDEADLALPEIAPAAPKPAASGPRIAPQVEPRPVRPEAKVVAPAAPKIVRGPEADPDQRFKRPADGPNVRPLVENPAQPVREGARPVERQIEKPMEKPAERQPEPDKPVVSHRPPASKVVTSSGKELTSPPPRTPNVKNPERFRDVSHKAPPASPFSQAKQAPRQRPSDPDGDLFFEDIDSADEFDEGEDRLAVRLKSLIAALFLVLVVGGGWWLFGTDGGAIFRASMGIGGSSAEAFRMLGDHEMDQGETKRAADAYYNALKLDGDNFEYSLLVGKSSQAVGDWERAIQAYQLCMDIDKTKSEPYRLLAELWEQRGSPEAGAQVRRKGYQHTGDATLVEGLQQN